ncbi:hypothetical protein, partial [Microbispora sp. GKU 823]|uniref:hypothetical protein n=1 Tax=Microbispora sp. GKU 823 TaxID=1652100 RepID=UPI001C4DFEB9
GVRSPGGRGTRLDPGLDTGLDTARRVPAAGEGAAGSAHSAAPVPATSAAEARRTRERGGRPASRE